MEETPAVDTADAAGVLSALKKAEDEFRDWNETCHTIDEIYNLHGGPDNASTLVSLGMSDNKLDLFWSSYEILKPAVYAKPPQPVVSPMFSDNRPVPNTTAEMLERATVSTFKRTCIDEVMKQLRDDVIFDSRGVLWVRYETDDGQCVKIVHKDRKDFLHEPARYWSEIGWVAGAEYLDRKDMKARFKLTEDDLDKLKFTMDRDDDGRLHRAKKCKVWEVWHKADNKVYWVSEGYDKFLDKSAPYLDLAEFWPVPRPAYATLSRRSLIPIPDYLRYRTHFAQISKLTSRIYTLLEIVRMKGLIAGSGDIATAVSQLMASNDDMLLVPVSGAGLIGGSGEMVSWLPLDMVANAITGLIAARGQLIDDFYQLSGISDIMRGASDADETLGAQQLKSQYGSVRVREKVQELQRIAADAVAIAAQIIADNFSKETLLEMSQMEIPTKAELSKRIKEIEQAGDKELKALKAKAEEAAMQAQQSGQPVEPEQAHQAEQAFTEAQQQILAKYAPMLQEVESAVPIEDVMKLLRDDKAMSFTFEIESSSTIMTDELQEKASRNEFVEVFTASSQAMMSLVALGPQGAKMAGALMKFQLAPYRAGRDLSSIIDEFIDAAPEMAERAQAAAGDDGSEGLVKAQEMLAQAEQMKAQAAMEGVKAKGQLDQAETQRKMGELQLKSQTDAQKSQEAMEKLRQANDKMVGDFSKLEAEVDKIRAETYKTLVDAGIAQEKQAMEQFRTVADVEMRQGDQAMQAENMAVDQQFRATDQQRAERGEERADQSQQFSQEQGERQQSFAEQQAQREGGQ